MTDRVLDKDRLRLVTPEMLNEYLHLHGWLVESDGDCTGGRAGRQTRHSRCPGSTCCGAGHEKAGTIR